STARQPPHRCPHLPSLSVSPAPAPPASSPLSLHDALPISVRIEGPLGGRAAGISIIYQELSLAPNLTVAENIYLGREVSQSGLRSEEHTSELQSRFDLVCRLLLEKKNNSCGATPAVPRSRM